MLHISCMQWQVGSAIPIEILKHKVLSDLEHYATLRIPQKYSASEKNDWLCIIFLWWSENSPKYGVQWRCWVLMEIPTVRFVWQKYDNIQIHNYNNTQVYVCTWLRMNVRITLLYVNVRTCMHGNYGPCAVYIIIIMIFIPFL